MSSTQLRRMVLGRAIRPYAFAVSLSIVVMATAIANGRAAGRLLSEWPGDILVFLSLLTSFMLWLGWWVRSDALMRNGLLWSTGVWAGISLILLVDGKSWVSGALGLCWVVASGGAWLLEMDEKRRVKPS